MTTLLNNWLSLRRETRLLRFQIGWKYREARLDALVELARSGPRITFDLRDRAIDESSLVNSCRNYVSTIDAKLFPWLDEHDTEQVAATMKEVRHFLDDVTVAQLNGGEQVRVPDLRVMQTAVSSTIARNIRNLQAEIISGADT